jgi:hypothetical protein
MGLGQRTYRLHEVEERRPFLLDDGLAEEVAQQVNLLAQGIAIGHGPHVKASRRGQRYLMC